MALAPDHLVVCAQSLAEGAGHVSACADAGCRLLALEVIHPRAFALAACLPVSFATGPRPGLRARLSTPAGDMVLQ